MQKPGVSPGSQGNHPPPRRKACGQCFKGKRRCDQQHPKCSRCKKLNLECKYSLTEPIPPSIRNGSTGELLELDAGLESRAAGASSLSLLERDNFPNDNDLQFLEANWNNSSYGGNPDPQDLPDYSLLFQQDSVNATLLDHVSQDLQNEAESRLHFGIEALKKAPSQMVLQNSTPWSHPLLYKTYMPKSMSDAHAACAIYMHKNDRNKQMVFRAVDTRAAELLKPQQNVTPVENLARIQSLLLYQIIRLFDGDIRLRAQGEAAMGDIELYIISLTRLIDDYNISENLLATSSQLPPSSSDFQYGSTQPPPHATWIFEESCRRTHLVSQFFLAIYAILKGGGCARSLISGTGWTISAPLWNAPSEFDFKVAWREKKRFIVQSLNLEGVLRDAMPEDVDDNGKIFLVGCIGLDDMREWFHQRGGTLIC